MITRNKYRTLIWIIVILVATNLSMGISFLYHKQQDRERMQAEQEEAIEVPAQRRTRFFRQRLNLRPEQMDRFREMNRDFNRTAWGVTHSLENLRVEMVEELGKSKPNQGKLNQIAKEIGDLHHEMKKETIDYYLKMRDECDEEQQKKLNEIFMSVLSDKQDIELPQRGRRNRFNKF